MESATTERAGGRLMTPAEVAEVYSTTNCTVLAWFHQGLIPAEVAEGKIIRFDLDRVRAALAKRAKRKG